MLRHADETREDRPEISRLLERLTAESRGWAEAELVLARLELQELKRQAISAAVYAVLGFAAVFAALAALTQAAIALLAPYVDGPGVAALIVAVVLVLLVVACALALRNALSWRTESIFFRWFGHRSSHDARP